MHPKGTEVYLLAHSQSDICLEKTHWYLGAYTF